MLKLTLLTLFVFLTPIVFARQEKVPFDSCEQKQHKEWLEAIQLFENDDFKESLLKFDVILKNCPNSLSSLSYKALISRLNQDYDTAIKTYEKMLSIKKKQPVSFAIEIADTYFEAAEEDIEKEVFDKAFARIKRGLELSKKPKEATLLLIHLSHKKKDYKACEQYATQYIAGDAQNAEVFFRRASCRMALNQTNNAILDITQSIRLEPETDAYIARANMYLSLGDCKSAMKDIKEAQKLDAELDSDPDLKEGEQRVLAKCPK